jgi:hypothetical protein
MMLLPKRTDKSGFHGSEIVFELEHLRRFHSHRGFSPVIVRHSSPQTAVSTAFALITKETVETVLHI